MTTDPSAVRPGKVAGLALIGVAAVATVIGVITLLGGNGDSAANQNPSSAPPVTTTVAPATGTAGSSETSAPTSATSAAPTTATTTTTAPVATTATAAPPETRPSTRDQPVRVYNNSLETGLAAKAAEDLAAHGWQVAEASNYPQGKIPTTTVYYRPGTEEEAAAKELAKVFGIRAEERFEGLKDASPGLILIVTRDYRSPSVDK
ncbi:tuberculin related peptide [Alloactinosynnema sp. L-07]|uniref:LytR C-terminal domain-containing protein n=1 Tax=Alloactinosynnema sp. L-07 TaxID=1653480 RepID=UPI00065F0778|nr:LytR C-terminal domain-containing protein [Alloactinosynnema sp. L-07]CRK61250.1 tuberculin related peptide [Alloactinosynnema sp. L-07]